MRKIVFEDATLTNQAKVTIDGVDHLVTEAEYNGGTDLNASTFNELQDNVEDAIEEATKEVYSTEEQVIGTWIDNSPIYRKVIIINSLPNNATTQYSHNISNVDKMLKCYGECSNSDNSVSFTLPITNINLWSDRTNINIATTSDRSSLNSKIIVEYTKTTD